MSGKQNNDNLEVSSEQLKAELLEIKDRLGALETIASISNKQVVETYVRTHLTTHKGRQIMKACQEPRTRDALISMFKFASSQALDYYLGPLRDAYLLRQHFDEKQIQTFEWGDIFKRLPKTARADILGSEEENALNKPRKGRKR